MAALGMRIGAHWMCKARCSSAERFGIRAPGFCSRLLSPLSRSSLRSQKGHVGTYTAACSQNLQTPFPLKEGSTLSQRVVPDPAKMPAAHRPVSPRPQPLYLPMNVLAEAGGQALSPQDQVALVTDAMQQEGVLLILSTSTVMHKGHYIPL